ncbi:hypothetical protein B0H13DRAFT_1871076 [Mycena leptocephala]|nr:hypothetical protein B0H13DRAFT_1871076 [Mycena leptocephala]
MTAFQAPQLRREHARHDPTLNPISPEPRKHSPQPRFWYSPVEPVAEEDKEQENIVHLYTDRPLSGQRGEHDLARGSAFPEPREEETKDRLCIFLLPTYQEILELIAEMKQITASNL